MSDDADNNNGPIGVGGYLVQNMVTLVTLITLIVGGVMAVEDIRNTVALGDQRLVYHMAEPAHGSVLVDNQKKALQILELDGSIVRLQFDLEDLEGEVKELTIRVDKIRPRK